MTEYERRRCIENRPEKGRHRKKRRKRKKLLIIIFCVELICIFCIIAFLIGRGLGERNTLEQESVSVSEKELYLSQSENEMISRLASDKENDITDTREEYDIILVNKEKSLPEDYSVTLKTLPDGVNKAAEEAYQPLCDMLKAGQKEGLSFEICSSYRSTARQKELFDEDLEALIKAGYTYQEAYEEVAKETMPPGYSEHSTGLAFDIVALGYQLLDEGQEETMENQWLQEHCAEYGFILRYPKGKEDITGISYESWHFRYVGVEAAEYIMQMGITLEEYLEKI